MTAGMARSAPILDAEALCRAGRTPSVPFTTALDDGRIVTVSRLLRVLPGRRVVGEGRIGQTPALVKLFIGDDSTRHWQRENEGIHALARAGIPTPETLFSGALRGDGRALLTRFLPDAVSLAEAWANVSGLPAGDAQACAVIEPAIRVVGRMHAEGLIHEDPHLGNFLRQDASLFVIDGDAIRSPGAGSAVSHDLATRNLALLLAQLPAEWDAHLDTLLSAYGTGRVPGNPADGPLLAEITRARKLRLKHFLEKTVRDCTRFSVEKTLRRFSAVVRDAAPWLQPVVDAPNSALTTGTPIKAGRTASVARVDLDGHRVVIKRYNLKNHGHAFSRLWRPSRAWHAWHAAHRLAFLGIATPAPLAMIEERLGPLRRRAWLITEFCPGRNLVQHLAADDVPPGDEADAIVKLFRGLHRERISHGDLKATNLLWHDNRIFVIDLDAMRQHRADAAFRRAWGRDRARLLRNWPAGSTLHAWLAENLPPA